MTGGASAWRWIQLESCGLKESCRRSNSDFDAASDPPAFARRFVTRYSSSHQRPSFDYLTILKFDHWDSLPLTAARTLLLNGLGLLDDPFGKASALNMLAEIERLGFVQLESINIVERAHHHILWMRHHNYQPGTLHKLQAAGSIFEHWTHDASVIPAKWFP